MANTAKKQSEYQIKEDETTLRRIIKNTSEEDSTFTKDIPKEKILPFIGMKVGKVYRDLMLKINIIKMDIYTFYKEYQDFLTQDKKYKDANDLDKLNIKANITDLKNYIGTIADFKNNLK